MIGHATKERGPRVPWPYARYVAVALWVGAVGLRVLGFAFDPLGAPIWVGTATTFGTAAVLFTLMALFGPRFAPIESAFKLGYEAGRQAAEAEAKEQCAVIPITPPLARRSSDRVRHRRTGHSA